MSTQSCHSKLPCFCETPKNPLSHKYNLYPQQEHLNTVVINAPVFLKGALLKKFMDFQPECVRSTVWRSFTTEIRYTWSSASIRTLCELDHPGDIINTTYCCAAHSKAQQPCTSLTQCHHGPRKTWTFQTCVTPKPRRIFFTVE